MFKKSMKTLIIVVIALTLTGFTYAFAATNTVPASKAGDGTGVISGYTVSNIHYTLDTTTPANIASVTFTLDSAASSVAIKLTAWHTCDIAADGVSVTCDTTGTVETALGALNLQVVAAN